MLLVDDEPFVARAFKRYLGDHQVRIATSGNEALEMLKLERFDVILCDMAMPDMDGAMVYEAVSLAYPGLERRIVFCSGGAHTPSTRAFIAKTRILMLEKPLTAAALRSAIATALAVAI